MENNFTNLASVIAFIMNASGVGTLFALLEAEDLNKIQTDLRKSFQRGVNQGDFVVGKIDELKKKLIPILLLLVVNLIIFIGIILMLILIPKNMPKIFKGSITEPSSQLDRIIYWAYISVALLIYIIRCVIPSKKIMSFLIDAKSRIVGE